MLAPQPRWECISGCRSARSSHRCERGWDVATLACRENSSAFPRAPQERCCGSGRMRMPSCQWHLIGSRAPGPAPSIMLPHMQRQTKPVDYYASKYAPKGIEPRARICQAFLLRAALEHARIWHTQHNIAYTTLFGAARALILPGIHAIEPCVCCECIGGYRSARSRRRYTSAMVLA